MAEYIINSVTHVSLAFILTMHKKNLFYWAYSLRYYMLTYQYGQTCV